MPQIPIAILSAVSALALGGCPFDEAADLHGTGSPTAGHPAHPIFVQLPSGRGAEATAGTPAYSTLHFPPVPSEATLCQLRFTNILWNLMGLSLDEAKKLLGETDQETQSAMDASLVYRFSGANQQQEATIAGGLMLNFLWRGSDVWSGEPGYYLQSADAQGFPRPACWPHKSSTATD